MGETLLILERERDSHDGNNEMYIYLFIYDREEIE